MSSIDATREITQLKALKKTIRKRVYRTSRLDKFHGELISLRRAGASAADLQRWLRKQRTNVHLTTVTRWLAKHG